MNNKRIEVSAYFAIMCTVTYYPFENGNFVLTSNRDESPERPTALSPKVYSVRNQPVIYPKDILGGGTWIGTSKNFTLCLLNGADVFHEKEGPYRMSRGRVLLNFFDYDDVDKFSAEHAFQEIEPFTLIVVNHLNGELHQLRWNGRGLDKQKLNVTKPYIWSSYTLYTDEVISQREFWFQEFLKSEGVDADALMNFHRFGGRGDSAQDLVMSRDGKVMTVSITQISAEPNRVAMSYADLISGQTSDINLHEV